MQCARTMLWQACEGWDQGTKMGWSNKETRERWDLVFKGVQTVAIVIGIWWAAITYWDTRYRDLSRPYEEKKLALYSEAGRVLAQLSQKPESVKKEEAESKFWQLFWGELPLVESDKVKQKMQEFCNIYFRDRATELMGCDKAAPGTPAKAKELAELACQEIKAVWAREPWYVRLFSKDEVGSC
jgi:hypothetical protein